MELDSDVEKRIKLEVMEFLKNGKPEWDIPHTLDSVSWMKKLIESEGGDERILVPTMYFHDTGYPVLNKGYDFDDLVESKKSHEEEGVKNVKAILPKLGFSLEEIDKISFLVLHHDEVEDIDSKDRQLVFEADTLAKINWKVVVPNFDKENCLRYLKYFKEKRMPRFSTKTGKKVMEKLLLETNDYFESI